MWFEFNRLNCGSSLEQCLRRGNHKGLPLQRLETRLRRLNQIHG
ncbi:MAG: hypothetical protein ABFS56_12525 [Pseudomonadota bacterium]